MSNTQFIFKNRFNTYYFRQRTPNYIIEQLPSAKKEVKISLHTKYRDKALIRAREHKVKFDALFMAIRNRQRMVNPDISSFSDLDEDEQETQMLSERTLQAIQDQQYTQQLFFLFERKKRLSSAFKRFDELKGKSLSDIDLSSVIKINQFIAIIDLLSNKSLFDPTPYLQQIKWKPTPVFSESALPDKAYDPCVSIKRLVIHRKKAKEVTPETPTQVKNVATKTRHQVKDTLLSILDNDINQQPSAVRTQVNDIREDEDVILEGISLDNEQDILNFAKLMSLIEKGESVTVADIEQCATPVVVPKSMLKMSELFDQFYKVRSKEWNSKTTHISNLAIYRSFTEIIGDIFVDHFDHAQANKYADILQDMPINRNKSPLFRDLSIDEILAFEGEYDRMSISNVNKYIGRISEALDWGINRGYLENNLMRTRKIKNTRQVQKEQNHKRERFSADQLATIFSAKEYHKDKYNRTYQYWLPLLGLYTGARIQEISQLRLDDIYKKDNVWVLDLNEYEDKKLKLPTCARLIPIHRRLIKLGFLKYHQHLLSCYESELLNTTLLFPDLLIGKGGYGHNSTKYFIRLIYRIGVKQHKDDGFVFHSFRHLFADEMKQIQCNLAMTAEILGHSLEGETLATYGKDYAVSTLKKEIDKYDPLDESILKKIRPFKFWKEIRPYNTMKTITEIDNTKSIFDDKSRAEAIVPRLNLPKRK